MPTVTLRAHYDGEQIVLDEPYDLPVDSLLMVTLIPSRIEQQPEHSEWDAVAADSLSRACGENEPDYSLADIKDTP